MHGRAALNDTPTLEAEARILARYLVDRDPSPAIAARYADAVRTLFPGETPAPAEQALAAFALRHPWALPGLDSVAALLQRGGLLRRRVRGRGEMQDRSASRRIPLLLY